MEWMGSPRKARTADLRHGLLCFRSIPRYSSLLRGTLVAVLTGSVEVCDAFRRKYTKKESVLSEQFPDGRLALVTTTSALGRSSIYNRLQIGESRRYGPVGFTRARATFISQTACTNPFTITRIAGAILPRCDQNEAQSLEPSGNCGEVSHENRHHYLLSIPWHQARDIHGATGFKHASIPKGEHQRLRWYRHTVDDSSNWFRERWLLPRAAKDYQYQAYQRELYRLWT